MNALRFLLCFTQILALGVVLFAPLGTCNTTITPETTETVVTPNNYSDPLQNDTSTVSDNGSSSQFFTSASPPSKKETTSSTTFTLTTTATTSGHSFNKAECRPVLVVAGGLIITCTILMVSMLMLACKVCQLRRRLKSASINGDLISNSEYWMGTAKSNKTKTHETETEAKETTVLMSDLGQIPEEDKSNGAIKEDGGKEGEEKKVGGALKTEEVAAAPVTEAETSPSTKAHEETDDSQASKATEAPTSTEETEKPDKEKK